ncbi:hypothetical protein D3C72_2290710 [compost metagenome]
MVTVDAASGIDQDDIARLVGLVAVGPMRQRGRLAEGDDAEARAALGAQRAMLVVDEADDF